MVYQRAKIEVGSLRYRLQQETKEIHEVTNKCMQANIFDDVHPRLQKEAYRHLLLQLYPLYEALESELETCKEHPVVGPVYFPDELSRLRALEEDLDYYYDHDWRRLLDTDITPVMRRYVERIHNVARSQPELLLAHSYTRYLGDVSGGQVVRRLIKKQCSLPGEEGVSFYHFDNLESVEKFKDLYTARMNSTPLDEEGKTAQVEESKRAFQFNISVFEEVGAMFRKTEENPNPALVAENHGSSDDDREIQDSNHWHSLFKMASLTIGVSAAILMLLPWFNSVVLK